MHPERDIGWHHFVAALVGAFVLHALAVLAFQSAPTGLGAAGQPRGTAPSAGGTTLRLALRSQAEAGAVVPKAPPAPVEWVERAESVPTAITAPEPARRVKPSTPAPTPTPAPARTPRPPSPIAAAEVPTPATEPAAGRVGTGAEEARSASAVGEASGRPATSGTDDAAGSGGAGNALALTTYLDSVYAQIVREHRYPRRAERRGIEGLVVLSVSIDRRGEIEGLTVAESSGSAQLDRAALETLRRAAPFGPVPDALSGADLAFEIPIEFALTD